MLKKNVSLYYYTVKLIQKSTDRTDILWNNILFTSAR